MGGILLASIIMMIISYGLLGALIDWQMKSIVFYDYVFFVIIMIYGKGV